MVGGLPILGRLGSPGSPPSGLSRIISFAALSGKLAAAEITTRPEAEWPMKITLAPSHVVDHRHGVAHMGIERIVLARAPVQFAPAAPVERHHLAVARKRPGDADPVVGIEIIGAMHDHDRGRAARTEGAVEDRDVAGLHASDPMRHIRQRHVALPKVAIFCRLPIRSDPNDSSAPGRAEARARQWNARAHALYCRRAAPGLTIAEGSVRSKSGRKGRENDASSRSFGRGPGRHRWRRRPAPPISK